MAKKVKRSRKPAPQQKKETNWVVIGGFIAIGVIGLFALLYASLQGDGTTSTDSAGANTLLEEYCDNNPDNCVREGDPEAPVTVVEVSDYGCGHCANFNLGATAEILKETYVTSSQVQWVVLPYALQGQSGYPTLPSAQAAMCANEQGQFEGYHTSLFGLQSTPAFNTESGFMDIAGRLGLDTDAFASCLAEGRYEEALLRNIQTATAAGVRGTPAFFINGEEVGGNQPFENFQRVIDSKLN